MFKISTKIGTGTVELSKISSMGAIWKIKLGRGEVETQGMHSGGINLNGKYGNVVTVDSKTLKKLTGLNINSDNIKLKIVSFSDGSKIPSGNAVSVNDLVRINKKLTKLDIINAIKQKPDDKTNKSPKKKFTGKIVDSGHGFFMRDTERNWKLVSKYGYDAVEKVD